MVLYGAGCVPSCASGHTGQEAPDRMALTRHDGQMHTLPNLVCLAWNRPMNWNASPLGGKTTDWRAVCREIRKSGSEGGGDETNRRVLPLSTSKLQTIGLCGHFRPQLVRV